MNKILRSLILSDLFILTGFGLVQPIFAVFLLKNITGSTITSVGIAMAIQLFVRAILQIMVGRWADREKGNKRELYALVAGSIIISLIPLGFAFSQTISHVYLLQCFWGMGSALTSPSWRVIFTRYADKDRAGYEWGVYDTVVSLGIAASASVGAYIAEFYSFQYLFIIVSIFSFLGTSFLIYVFKQEVENHRKKHTTKKRKK